ncbi:MAG: hypothetical protein ACE5DK_06425, partial [Paracoccaceae bacterium]
AALAAVRVTGGPVVVITGNGHARRDWGMPRALRTVAPEISILSIGQYELSVDDEPPVDLYLLTSAAEREDPCVGFVPPQNP